MALYIDGPLLVQGGSQLVVRLLQRFLSLLQLVQVDRGIFQVSYKQLLARGILVFEKNDVLGRHPSYHVEANFHVTGHHSNLKYPFPALLCISFLLKNHNFIVITS